MRLIGAGLVVNFLLLAPRWFSPVGSAPWLALEAPLLVGIFALLPPGRRSRIAAAVAAVVAVALGLLVLGDTIARQSLSRPLNLYLDVSLAGSVFDLLAGLLGTVAALLAAIALLVGAGLSGALLAVLLSPGRDPRTPTMPGRSAAVPGGALLLVSAVALVAPAVPGAGSALPLPAIDAWAGRPAVDVVGEQTRLLARMLEERERFAAEAASAPGSYAATPGLLEGLGGRDVVLAFIESYGISAVTDPRYAPVTVPRLEEMQRRLSGAGLHVATGTLVAPSQGGQSWLGHGSLMSGLWIENQLRYDLLLASGRDTLIDDFRHAGYRTAALVPAITAPWPEGRRLGYDRIWAHRDIDYAGPPLNWVTMPDQFTWSFLENAIRGADDPRPLFAEVSFISSHAPWTPILPVLDDWEGIGDGAVFASWKDAGESPPELWSDHDRVREHYALSVDYALHAATSYARRYAGDGMLLIVLGDHQPAPIITGEDTSRAVPVHAIAGDRALLEPFLDRGFVEGALPDPDRPAPRMDGFRDWFVPAFSMPPAAARGSHPRPGAGAARGSGAPEPAGGPGAGEGPAGTGDPDDATGGG